MTNWLIDSGNTKRGLYFSKMQDVSASVTITQRDDGSYNTGLLDENLYQYHSQTNPNSFVIFEQADETGIIRKHVGLQYFDESVSQPLLLDEIKNFLDSAQGETSPFVALQYQFASPDSVVSNREAIENSRYISKVTESDGSQRVIDVITGETVWSSPDVKSDNLDPVLNSI